jgi:acetyltransferase-like isoleucine patch superfamily enzyme
MWRNPGSGAAIVRRQMVGDRLQRVVWRGKLIAPYRRRQFASFGADSILHRPDWISHPEKIEIGSSVLMFHGLWLAAEQPAWHRSGPAIRIGDHVGVRPYCTISAAESVTIEDGVVISAFTTIIDSDHTFAAGRPNVMHNPLVSAPVRVGEGTWIGERVAVLRGSDIGRCCIIGANSVVRGTIPDHSIAVGAPARVVGSTKESFA